MTTYSIKQEIKKLTNIDFNKTIKFGIDFLTRIFTGIWFISGWFLGAFLSTKLPEILLKTNNLMNFNYLNSIDGFIVPLSILVWTMLGWILSILIEIQLDIPFKLKRQVLSLYEKLENTNNYRENIDELQILCENIYKNTRAIRKLLSINFLFTKEGKEKIQQLWILVTNITLSLLTDLRSDLSIRLTEQQQTLESAKSEVKNNITWTPELNQVSELQRARLDRQIEQFEELQRVLVKV